MKLHAQIKSILLSESQADQLLKQLTDWIIDQHQLTKTFTFDNYYQTIAFVNVIAWVAHQEDHHPDLEISYHQCHIRFTTHQVQGLTENDFICAAKIDHMQASS